MSNLSTKIHAEQARFYRDLRKKETSGQLALKARPFLEKQRAMKEKP